MAYSGYQTAQCPPAPCHEASISSSGFSQRMRGCATEQVCPPAAPPTAQQSYCNAEMPVGSQYGSYEETPGSEEGPASSSLQKFSITDQKNTKTRRHLIEFDGTLRELSTNPQAAKWVLANEHMFKRKRDGKQGRHGDLENVAILGVKVLSTTSNYWRSLLLTCPGAIKGCAYTNGGKRGLMAIIPGNHIYPEGGRTIMVPHSIMHSKEAHTFSNVSKESLLKTIVLLPNKPDTVMVPENGTIMQVIMVPENLERLRINPSDIPSHEGYASLPRSIVDMAVSAVDRDFFSKDPWTNMKAGQFSFAIEPAAGQEGQAEWVDPTADLDQRITVEMEVEITTAIISEAKP